MSHFNAVRPGTNLSQYARELTRIHDCVVSGSSAPQRPRAVVARSWQRVLQAGLDASRKNYREPLSTQEVLRRRNASPLRGVISDLLAVISGVADASRLLMVVADAEGVVLWRAGSVAVRSHADALGFTEGADWSEKQVGTNAIGTALAEAAPVQLFSAEHFEQAQHPWYCTAHPIHDPRTGELLGIVDVSGPALSLHPTIGALVQTAVRLAEAQLWRGHEERLARLRQSAEPLVAATRGPLLVVDEHGWVAHHHGIHARDRIAVPREGTALTIPGMGICLPERLHEGWLVRPAEGGRAITAVLQLGSPATLEVRSATDVWRMPLSERHAEVMQVLHAAGRSGMSAGQLSLALYGDGEHLVTVRAEISRMRRQLGTLVATKPYRIADDVNLTVLSEALG
ncbi:GAF domain-containing protein [Calidifontibacter sp. DB0510]|uniref:GAF domain-containing protein n=1 Tax=Metallococcus carri TaxID=1656884 RepID=A0A967B1P0_9MICO|nr:GAF domain-containing protein [Metallococcus carri]NOP35988.1 GAF domain-containing protein [Calidifontibacter sp. DB2511S]